MNSTLEGDQGFVSFLGDPELLGFDSEQSLVGETQATLATTQDMTEEFLVTTSPMIGQDTLDQEKHLSQEIQELREVGQLVQTFEHNGATTEHNLLDDTHLELGNDPNAQLTGSPVLEFGQANLLTENHQPIDNLTEERQNVQLLEDKEKVQPLAGEQNVQTFAGQQNLQQFPGHQNMQLFPGQQNLQQFPGQFNMNPYTGQQNVQQFPGQQIMQQFAGQQNMLQYGGQQNTQQQYYAGQTQQQHMQSYGQNFANNYQQQRFVQQPTWGNPQQQNFMVPQYQYMQQPQWIGPQQQNFGFQQQQFVQPGQWNPIPHGNSLGHQQQFMRPGQWMAPQQAGFGVMPPHWQAQPIQQQAFANGLQQIGQSPQQKNLGRVPQPVKQAPQQMLFVDESQNIADMYEAQHGPIDNSIQPKQQGDIELTWLDPATNAAEIDEQSSAIYRSKALKKAEKMRSYQVLSLNGPKPMTGEEMKLKEEDKKAQKKERRAENAKRRVEETRMREYATFQRELLRQQQGLTKVEDEKEKYRVAKELKEMSMTPKEKANQLVRLQQLRHFMANNPMNVISAPEYRERFLNQVPLSQRSMEHMQRMHFYPPGEIGLGGADSTAWAANAISGYAMVLKKVETTQEKLQEIGAVIKARIASGEKISEGESDKVHQVRKISANLSSGIHIINKRLNNNMIDQFENHGAGHIQGFVCEPKPTQSVDDYLMHGSSAHSLGAVTQLVDDRGMASDYGDSSGQKSENSGNNLADDGLTSILTCSESANTSFPGSGATKSVSEGSLEVQAPVEIQPDVIKYEGVPPGFVPARQPALPRKGLEHSSEDIEFMETLSEWHKNNPKEPTDPLWGERAIAETMALFNNEIPVTRQAHVIDITPVVKQTPKKRARSDEGENAMKFVSVQGPPKKRKYVKKSPRWFKASKSIKESAAEPAVAQTIEQVVKPVAAPVSEHYWGPVGVPAAEPVMERVARGIAEQVMAPTVETLFNPRFSHVAKPIAERAVDPVFSTAGIDIDGFPDLNDDEALNNLLYGDLMGFGDDNDQELGSILTAANSML
ncbi:MAG: hypothetical protein M1829_000268 [Trizodia sp. TS-e1964]|nr:MAG: hypothetical protein M1829_000268 [Trizodia sp. TS-e1964]